MSAAKVLSTQPYFFEPGSDLERGENEDEPAKPRLQMNASQRCIVTIFTPSTSIPGVPHSCYFFKSHRPPPLLYF
ncbi:hypothetical protein CHARACLAT_001547 [Characodon lateralis]|uniref:Uncharacterized protein n=1 Tax=Characodon lateralis TaxID=208331 RepID=A0ABU7CVU0_9TELE|nr:hypothetical protein [Characodon lateralis]